MIQATYLKWEIAKVINYKPFWVVVLIYLLVPPFVVSLSFIQQLTGGGNAVLLMLYSKFNLMLAFIPIMQVSDDFHNKTIRQNIIDGLGRSEYILSKLIYHTFVGLLIHPLIIIVLVISLMNPSLTITSWICVNVLEISFVLTLATLITLLTRTAGLATITLIFTYCIEFILASSIDITRPINKLVTPLTTIRNIVPFQDQSVSALDVHGLGVLIFYILVINVISITFLNKIDL